MGPGSYTLLWFHCIAKSFDKSFRWEPGQPLEYLLFEELNTKISGSKPVFPFARLALTRQGVV